MKGPTNIVIWNFPQVKISLLTLITKFFALHQEEKGNQYEKKICQSLSITFLSNTHKRDYTYMSTIVEKVFRLLGTSLDL